MLEPAGWVVLAGSRPAVMQPRSRLYALRPVVVGTKIRPPPAAGDSKRLKEPTLMFAICAPLTALNPYRLPFDIVHTLPPARIGGPTKVVRRFQAGVKTWPLWL